MVQKLRAIILPRKSENDLKKQILEVIRQTLFEPLLSELEGLAVYYNSKSAIAEALLSGKIEYSNGIFRGQFNAKITREFNALGISFDKRIKGYRKEISSLPTEIQAAIGQANAINTTISQNLVAKLTTFPLAEEVLEKAEFNYEESIGRIDGQFKSIAQALEVSIDLTDEQKQIIAEEYSQNLRLTIKKFLDEQIISLRNEVSQSVKAGYRANHLKKIILQRYAVSDSKAEFLAKQETSLLTSRYTQLRFKDAGVDKYEWSSSKDSRVRHDHAKLDGKIIFYDNPPIVDEETGRRAHAGEDYGCRCVQIPVID